MWDILEWAAWAVSAAIFLWMVYDAWQVSQKYSEDTLISSREGVDELVEKKGS
ncbi:MAG TPA: hypothetical protein VMT98_00310 [Verrucomicrobiae bacterium]|nr:hypothetical protein [Verrucomicrobiae bacterium]